MSLQWLTAEEERKLTQEFNERELRAKGNYRPLDYDAEMQCDPHLHKRDFRPDEPARLLLVVGAFVLGLAAVVCAVNYLLPVTK